MHPTQRPEPTRPRPLLPTRLSPTIAASSRARRRLRASGGDVVALVALLALTLAGCSLPTLAGLAFRRPRL